MTKNTAMNIWRVALFLFIPLSAVFGWITLLAYLIGIVIGFLGHALDSRGSTTIKVSDVVRMLF